MDKIDRIISIIQESKKSKKCPAGHKYDKKLKTCVTKKSMIRYGGGYWGGRRDNEDDEGKGKNGKNGNGSNGNGSNGNGNGNGGSGNGNCGGGNGGNGGGNGGGRE